MMYIKWFVLAILTLPVMLVNAICSPVISLFIDKHGNLPYWLSWFQTDDAPAYGDKMFQDREMAYTKNLPDWLSRYIRGIAWAIRNPAYGFMSSCGIRVNEITEYQTSGKEIDIGDGGYNLGTVFRTCRNNGIKYFNFKAANKWNDKYGWMIEFGWTLNNVDKELDGVVRRLAIDIRPLIKLS